MYKDMVKQIKRALISVSDKNGIIELASALHAQGIEILSTGGSAKLLQENGIAVKQVSEHTGFPEIMDGRVKTLHPKIHGGLLGRRDQDAQVMQQHDIVPIDLLVVNLYPFENTIAQADCTLPMAIENIDIGGPAMLRAAAKNHNDVAVVVDSTDYAQIIEQLHNQRGLSQQLREQLAAKAFAHTAAYDGAIANYLSVAFAQSETQFPEKLTLQAHKKYDLRYGENPHQLAAFYSVNQKGANIANAKLIQGKALSFNNIADSDAALQCVMQFADVPACVIVKHANPCGVSVAHSVLESYEQAYQTDPESAFGGIIAFNQSLDADTAAKIIAQQFVEVIIAPEITADARAILETKGNVRVLQCGALITEDKTLEIKQIAGGLLLQNQDVQLYDTLKVVTECQPDEGQMQDLLFSWKVAKYVKSNAIIYAKNQMTIGVGAGQMSRVNSARIAAIKAQHAGLDVAGSVMASDAFFPFRDAIDNAAKDGIKAIIQPGGSMRDEEVIAAANEHGIAMVFTNMRHFRH